jgi:glycine oxidase
MKIRVIGAGVAGLTLAYAFARAGCAVEVIERAAGPGLGCSNVAGGMLAPWCEAESAEPLVVSYGIEALTYWTDDVPVAHQRGSLVVAPARDLPDLTRFARRTSSYETYDGAAVAALEPDLEGRFERALFFSQEAHLDPRAAMAKLSALLAAQDNVVFRFNCDAHALNDDADDWTIDCRGFDARDQLPDLRGVRGEMLMLRTQEISLKRPVRLLHPRYPVYIVPRGDGRFMVGATMIESGQGGAMTARSALELLSAACTVHPAFGEAEIIEMGANVRPAFADNLPRLRRDGRTLFVNGLFRHGFLLAPALACRAVDVVLKGAHFPEIMDADPRERQRA